jgi:hypothetical protein
VDSLIHATDTISFSAVSSQAEQALAGLDARAWTHFLVAVAIVEGSVASGRPPGRVVVELAGSPEELFILDLTPIGSPVRLVCARRGRKILVARVVAGRRRVGQKEIRLAAAAIEEWRTQRRKGRRKGRR